MLNSVSILIQVCERASRVSQLPISVGRYHTDTYGSQPFGKNLCMDAGSDVFPEIFRKIKGNCEGTEQLQ